MPEMPHAGEHHGDAALVGCPDDFVVAHAAAGLDDGARARVDHHIEPVAERKEGVRGDHRAFERQPGRRAFMAAMRALSMRLIWPAPTPMVMPPEQNTMALDFTNFATRQAKRRSAR